MLVIYIHIFFYYFYIILSVNPMNNLIKFTLSNLLHHFENFWSYFWNVLFDEFAASISIFLRQPQRPSVEMRFWGCFAASSFGNEETMEKFQFENVWRERVRKAHGRENVPKRARASEAHGQAKCWK